jgi:hypothetical protein
MSDRKFHGLSDGILGAERTGRLLAACWSLAEAATCARSRRWPAP